MCNGSFPVGEADRRSATIHSRQPPRCSAKNGLTFREKNVLAATDQPSDREGKPDFYSPLSLALGLLGGDSERRGPGNRVSVPAARGSSVETNEQSAGVSDDGKGENGARTKRGGRVYPD